MSMSTEQFFADLDALEKEIPTLEQDSLEERRWGDRMIQFCKYANTFFPIPKDLSALLIATFNEGYKHPGLWCARDVIAPYPGRKALEEDSMNHQREGRKEFIIRYRDYLEMRYKYLDTQPQKIAIVKGWWYLANGQTAQILLNGKYFILSDPNQTRGKNFAEHLMTILSLPNRRGVAIEAEFKRRVSAEEGSYSDTGKSSTFKNAIDRINQIFGKTPTKKTFLLPTADGCKVDEKFIAEFDPNLTQA